MSPSPNDDGDPSPGDRRHKVQLTGEKATLLITLYAKALDSRSKHSILNDKKADEMVRMIDYDFEKLRRPGNGSFIVARAKTLDDWTGEFLRSRPEAVVLNLGCGLDTRVCRIAPPPGVSWFDLDFPEVIRERQNFFSNRDGYQMLEASVTEPGWLEEVPRDRPTMVIAEGLFEYLTVQDVKSLLNRLTRHLPSGRVAFDVMNSFAINSGRRGLKAALGAEHRWAVDDVHHVDVLDPKLKRTASLSILGSRHLPSKYRLGFGMVWMVPRFRNMIRLLRYEF
jgi:O-methyltransferase involved in polyketide biosynthesis